MLPKRDGLEVLTALRRRGLQTPVRMWGKLYERDRQDSDHRGAHCLHRGPHPRDPSHAVKHGEDPEHDDK
jgi:hypothetical protein